MTCNTVVLLQEANILCPFKCFFGSGRLKDIDTIVHNQGARVTSKTLKKMGLEPYRSCTKRWTIGTTAGIET